MNKLNQLFLYLVFIFGIVQCNKIKVTIPDGILEGSTLKDYDDRSFYGFRRIPFAKPPVGEYKFKAPEKNDPWNGVRDATDEMPICNQPTKDLQHEVGQEDCLYLDVFTHSIDSNALKPVMLYIHGGKFYQRSGREHQPEFIMTENIVYVVINYRLGVYGFINTINADPTGNAEAIANNGFKDQVLAMKWMQNNIKYFGGNPNQVTICGESAGGISVHAHILSPLSAGLFHRVIMMSGSTTIPSTISKLNTATALASYLKINYSDPTDMISELRKVPNQDLNNAAKQLNWFDLKLNEPNLSSLVIEKPGKNSFISDYPSNIIRSGSFSKVPLMLGTTSKEGYYFYHLNQKDTTKLDTYIPFYYTNREEVLNKVKQFYQLKNTPDTIQNLIDFYSDVWFKYQMFRTARGHAKWNQSVYYYEFNGDAQLNLSKQHLYKLAGLSGACHADELGYLYPAAGIPAKNSVEESIMRNMVKLWINFVKTGQPIDKLQPFTVNQYNFVNISNNGLTFGVLNERSLKFWDNIEKEHGNSLY